MADYDNKLGKWFKLVEEQEKELKEKKKPTESQLRGKSENIGDTEPRIKEV